MHFELGSCCETTVEHESENLWTLAFTLMSGKKFSRRSFRLLPAFVRRWRSATNNCWFTWATRKDTVRRDKVCWFSRLTQVFHKWEYFKAAILSSLLWIFSKKSKKYDAYFWRWDMPLPHERLTRENCIMLCISYFLCWIANVSWGSARMDFTFQCCMIIAQQKWHWCMWFRLHILFYLAAKIQMLSRRKEK